MESSLRWLLVKILISCLLVEEVTAEGGEECHPAKTCSKCMTIHPMCSWCKDENTVFDGPRCDLQANLVLKRCMNVTSKQSTLEAIKDMDLQDQVYTSDEEVLEVAVPIAPQQVNLNLRLGDKKTIDVRVLQVKDYPLDLYYLMDMSTSMDNDLDNLKSLAADLVKDMKNITRSLALGFGLFVDKPVSPYIDIAPNKIHKPCETGQTCQKTFDFRNSLPLTKDTSLFAEEVKSTQISGNQDVAEGTLDAIMQVAVCKEEIGWRENSRKILLITSDGPLHAEGDGKREYGRSERGFKTLLVQYMLCHVSYSALNLLSIKEMHQSRFSVDFYKNYNFGTLPKSGAKSYLNLAGILRPNDGNCHLKDNEYEDAHLYDYPSLGHVNEKLVNSNIIPIFAVSEHHDMYQGVIKLLQGASYAKLSKNSENILQILATRYKEITNTIRLVHSAKDGVELRISSDCKEDSSSAFPIDGYNCTNVSEGDKLLFKVEIKATKCVDQTFDVYPIGFDQRLTVQVKVECACSCDYEPTGFPFKTRVSFTQLNSSYCGDGGGDQVCGICRCKPGRYGDNCECTGESEENQDEREKDIFCKPDNSTTLLCSGRGECICGQCRCRQPGTGSHHEIVSGTYCECNNQACPRDEGEVCGGYERGECVCAPDGRTNECRCRPGYTGKKCSCPTQTDTCRSRNGLLCNAAGNCVCGKCECDKESKFSGPRCDECLTCTDCDLHIRCVQCKLFNYTEHLSVEECEMCSQDIKNVTEVPGKTTERTCTFLDRYNCSVSFVYEEVSTGIVTIYVKEEKDCAHSDRIETGIKVHMLITYIVAGILFVGLIAILILRLYIWHLDRVEVKRFLEERKKTKWSKETNPIFKQNVQKFDNPMYGK